MGTWLSDHLLGPPCPDWQCFTPLVAGLSISHVICVIEIVVLLTLLSRKTRTAANGSAAAAIDCILPAYRSALVFIITAFILQLAILLSHIFVSFDPESLLFFFVYYGLLESLTFFFLRPSVTKRSLRRAILWAVAWGFYAAGIAYISAIQSEADAGETTEDVYDDFNTDFSWRALYLCIDAPRFFAYMFLIKYISVRPRDSVLPYAVLQAFTSGIAIVYSLVYLAPKPIRRWALWIPFTLLCLATVISPWVIHSTFVLDSNYWRGVSRPSRLRGFGVFIRILSSHAKIPNDYLNLTEREDVDLFADLLTDSLVSKPLQKMLEAAKNCLVDFAFVEIEDKLLGRGSFAKVFRGRYKGNPCAVKIFLKQPDIDAHSIKLFAEETQVAIRMNHPNIVKFHGLCVRPPSVFLVFELCEQGDLFGVLSKRRAEPTIIKCTVQSWDWTRILRSCLEAALPIAYLHRKTVNYIHRDIKSLNYLVTSNGTIKLTDFGTSRFMPLLNRVDQSNTLSRTHVDSVSATNTPHLQLPSSTSFSGSSGIPPAPPPTLTSTFAPTTSTSSSTDSSSSSSTTTTTSSSSSSSSPTTSSSSPSSSSSFSSSSSPTSSSSSIEPIPVAPPPTTFALASLNGVEEEENDEEKEAKVDIALSCSNSAPSPVGSLGLSLARPSKLRASRSAANGPSINSTHQLPTPLHSFSGLGGDMFASVTSWNVPRESTERDPSYLTRGVGTLSWMAPEIAQGRAYGKPSDVFSLCIVLWEIITGRQPYEDTSRSNLKKTLADLRSDIKQVCLEVLEHSPDPEHSARWEELRVLVESGLSVRASTRPSSDEIVQKLQALSQAKAEPKLRRS